MAASGFSWCILILLALAGHEISPRYVTDGVVSGSMAMGFIVLAPAIVCSGLAIWLDSWKRAFREGGFLNYGVAVYNTYAQIHNTVAIVQGMGEAGKSAGELFKGSGKSGSSSSSGSSTSADDVKGMAILVAILLVVIAFIGGTLLTYYIIRCARRNDELPWALRERLAQSQQAGVGARGLQHA